MGHWGKPLTEVQVLAWADMHHRQTGTGPQAGSGPVQGAAGEHWGTIDKALADGCRGLPGGDSLSRLLDRRRRSGEVRRPGPWTPGEDELVRTLSAKEAARRTGRGLGAVYHRRHELGLPDTRRGT
jgi:hypothetical protein